MRVLTRLEASRVRVRCSVEEIVWIGVAGYKVESDLWVRAEA